MKIFIDTANLEEIKEMSEMGILDGVTTNPTLLAREVERTGMKPNDILLKICEMVDGPVSAEVIALDTEGMVKEARELSKLHKNICIKIPMTEEGVKAVKILESEGIMTNVTLVFSVNQALFALKAGASFVSPFIGRLDDRGHYGMELVSDILRVIDNYGFKTQVIVASVRHPVHVKEAMILGAHICTIPYKVLKLLFKHPLTDDGIKRFLNDWEKAKKILGK